MKFTHRIHADQRGFTLIELAIVAAIITIMAGTAFTIFLRFKHRNQVGQGIRQIYQIKKALDSYARECTGYPIRTPAGSWNQLRVIIDRQAPTFPLGLPIKYPSRSMCDAVSLNDYINTNMLAGTCDLDDAGCSETISKSSGVKFGSLFVADGAGPGYSQICNANDGFTNLGWNYVLLTDASDPTLKPIPVICANVIVRDGTTTDSMSVVINGSGVANGVQTVDGAGIIGPDGAALPDACTCGAWCEDHLRNETGCCQPCTDAAGVRLDGMNYKY